MRILIVGDTHGNGSWLERYIYPIAMSFEVEKIVVLGDFGYWEHQREGEVFLDNLDSVGEQSGIPLYWLHGNHDKWSLAVQRYGHLHDDEGFMPCRTNVLYIPQGYAWQWAGRSFRSFGGAYSVDKQNRLQLEQRNYERLARKEEYRASAKNVQPRPVPSQAGTLWFPEEEMSDAEMDALLAADSSPKRYVLSHDKPLASRPAWNRKDLPLCVPNQVRLQRALEVHKPAHWFHGHLHYRYSDEVRASPANIDDVTVVSGLCPDVDAAEFGWHPSQTWLLLDLHDDGRDDVLPGDTDDVIVDRQRFQDAARALA